jgi:Tfp pilus assembly protein PilV
MTPRDKRLTPSIKRRTNRGFTLAEALIASVFLAISALGVAGAMAAASMQAKQAQQSTNCQALARELIEEVTSKSFSPLPNFGWSSGQTNRAAYDDVADYNGYANNTTNGITTLSGATINFGDGATYSRTVAFEYRATPNGVAVATGEFGMVTVTVTSSGGASTQLQRLVSSTVVKR